MFSHYVRPPTRTPGRFKSGLYYCASNRVNQTTGIIANGDLRLAPFEVARAATFDRISTEVTIVATAGGVLRMGLYLDDGSGYPGTLLLDAGTVDTTTTGVKEITISQALSPGLYWLGAAPQGAPATQATIRQFTSSVTVGIGSTANFGSNPGSYAQASVTGALPGTFTSTVTTSATVPLIYLRAV